ncbi:MAG: hypothetical protein AAF726_02330 [Planctomycetota bacterium]
MLVPLVLGLAAFQSADALPTGPLTPRALGGAFASPFSPPVQGAAVSGRVLEITLAFSGQTYEERFVLGIPANLQVPAPVLTLFHGYGEEPLDVVQNTPLVQEAMQRGWLVFVPLGAHKFNYGIDYAQENIELAFSFLSARLNLDLDRIYAVGFSMGGGAAASFASRHLDPNGIRIAALVNHTGTTSLRATFQTTTANNQNFLRHPLMFGGTPDQVPFRYRRSSTVDYDALAGTIDANSEMASNIAHIATRHWNAEFDPNLALIDQTVRLHERMLARGADSARRVVTSSVHTWTTLDSTAVLDWLEQQTLSAPAAGSVAKTFADRDGRWHELDIVQDRAGELTPVLWSSQPSFNTLYLIEMANAASIGTDVVRLDLDTTQPLKLVLQTLDASEPDIVLSGVPSAPSDVRRGGVSVPSWSYDATSQTLTLHESGRGWATWTVVP